MQIYLSLSAWALIYSFIGIANTVENFKIIIGFLMGLSIFIIFYELDIEKNKICYCLSIVIGIHLAYFLLQFIFYYLTGSVLNIYSAIGLEPRALSLVFRPTGLFLEPAAYALTMFMLLSLRTVLLNRVDFLFFLSLGSVLLSFSLWGLVVSIFFFIYALRANIFWLTVFGCLLVILMFFLSDYEIVRVLTHDFLLNRIENIDSDGSGWARYGGLIDGSDSKYSNWILLFGQGLSNNYQDYGSNGFSFLLSASGLIGVLCFFLLIALANKKFFLIKFFVFCLFLTAAPIWGNFFWWFWLALFLKSCPIDNSIVLKEKTFNFK